MGLFDRVSRVVRSNLNSVVSSAEDPEKILEQTVVDMQEDLVQLRQAVAQAIASQKRLQQQYNQAQTQSTEWQRRAQLALQKGNEDLAREALTRRKTFNDTASGMQSQLAHQTTQVEALKRNLTALESKLAEAKTKKEMLTARARAAKASEQINKVMGRTDTTSAIGAFDRMEQKVLEAEARSEAVAELATDDLEGQFAQLESGTDIDVELLEMKREAGLLPPATQEALPAAKETPEDAELKKLREELDRT